MTLYDPSLLNGLAIGADTPNEYYATVCKFLMGAPEVDPIQSGPAHGRRTKELHPAMAVIANSRKRIITAHGRVTNLPFALAEVIQILAGINDPQALRHYNSKIIQIQGDKPWQSEDEIAMGELWEDRVTRFNAAYGERLRAYDFTAGQPFTGTRLASIDQIKHVVETLRADPNSRQASIVLSHPYWDNKQIQTKDRACNVYAHAMIRDGKLDWMQIMRSNDAIWGLPYNLIQWGHVQEYVAIKLGVPIGRYTLVQDSLHVYEDFYDECDKVEPFDMYGLFGPEELFPMISDIRDVAYWEKLIRNSGPIAIPRDKGELDYWIEVMYVFNAYGIFKEKMEKEENILKWMPYTLELRWPLLRWFCSTRWAKLGNPINKEFFNRCVNDMTGRGVNESTAIRWLMGV